MSIRFLLGHMHAATAMTFRFSSCEQVEPICGVCIRWAGAQSLGGPFCEGEGIPNARRMAVSADGNHLRPVAVQQCELLGLSLDLSYPASQMHMTSP